MDKLKKCKTCGAEIAKSAKACPHCGAKQKGGNPILGGILIFIGIVMIVGVVNGGNSGTKVDNSDSSKAPQSEPPKEEIFTVGDSVKLNDVIVTLNSVEKNKGSAYNTPSDGNVFLICEFTIENNRKDEVAISSMLSFTAYADDYSSNLSLSALIEKGDRQQLDGKVDAGKKMNGVIGYEVPSDFNVFEIRFAPNVWSGAEVTFIYENK